MIKRLLQNLFAKILDDPSIPVGKTCGYSLVKSEKAGCKIADNTKIYPPFFLHNVKLGSYSFVAKNCSIKNCEIGKFCSIGPNFCCGLGIHPTNGISTSPMFYSTAIQNGMTLCEKDKLEESKRSIIGSDVFIGANVTILDGVMIGDGAVIGAGAVVVKDIPAYAVAVGVPAKVVKYRFDKDTIEKLQGLKWWNWSLEELKKVEMNFWNMNEFVK